MTATPLLQNIRQDYTGDALSPAKLVFPVLDTNGIAVDTTSGYTIAMPNAPQVNPNPRAWFDVYQKTAPDFTLGGLITVAYGVGEITISFPYQCFVQHMQSLIHTYHLYVSTDNFATASCIATGTITLANDPSYFPQGH